MQNRNYSQGAEPMDGGVSFRTWATGKNRVSLVLLDEHQNVFVETEMQRTEDGYYESFTTEAKPLSLYKYRLDGNLFPDPASRFQPFGVHAPSQVIDARPFVWSDLGWNHASFEDMVIYELHIGTFSHQGTYAGIVERFDHLARLGVNTLELMPIADFPGRWNWGYDCVCLYAPSRAYGSPDNLRWFINEAHRAGFTVLLDVVYNHLGPDGNYLGAYSPDYFNPKHDTPWGLAFNFDCPGCIAVRHFFGENPLYWLNEFHIDGFRLDATQAIPDDSPKHIVQEIAESVQAQDRLVICEDPRNDRRIILPRKDGGFGCDAVWADDLHHVVRVQMAKESEGYLGYFKGTPEELVRTLREGWLFTGQTQKDGLPRGTTGADLPPQRFVHCISNHDQVGNRAFGDRMDKLISPVAYRAASGLLLLVPYTPMLFMGQEWACESPFCYFTDHEGQLGRNIAEGRRREFAQFADFRDPAKRAGIPDAQAESTFMSSKLSWSDLDKPDHLAVFKLYEDFIRFRKEHLLPRKRGDWQVELVTPVTCALRYQIDGYPSLLILVQLAPAKNQLDPAHSLLEISKGQHWNVVLSTNAGTYSGQQTGQDPSDPFSLNEPETRILMATGN
jgi:maltooligosyltrehalose trehalohydrolase